MIRSFICLALIGTGAAVLAVLLWQGQRSYSHEGVLWQQKRQLVAVLGITDLSLSSEARYTRHVTQADLFSAFQDFPGSLEHFPSGSTIPPRPVGLSGRAMFEPLRQE